MVCFTKFGPVILLSCLLLSSAWRQEVACDEEAQVASSTDETTTSVARLAPNEESVGTANDSDQLQDEPLKLADNYLQLFGYMDEIQPGEQLKENVFEDSVREFQRFMNITETGKLDELTLVTMKKPRCGNKDFDKQEFIDGKREQESDSVRRKRYTLFGNTKWPKKLVTYRVVNYPGSRKLNKRSVELIIDRAFNSWSQKANVNFSKRRGAKADIELSFVKGKHECASKKGEFYPPKRRGGGGILAHAFNPGSAPHNGDVHFNDHFNWSAGASEGYENLFATAIHELGHSLGLGHSEFKEAIMFPTANDVSELHKDDQRAIRKVYGARDDPRGGSPKDDEHDDDEDGDGDSDIPISCGARNWLPGPSCRLFYDCRHDEPKLRRCPKNLVWNDKKNWCDFRHNVPNCRKSR